ncbi:MAG TPA: thiamine-phosphate kinase [Burkholderiaceae bacterium]|jgi:thiamine-monophosphate kinase|nr:thiamine-phosphate kinase [Burkholderiaceae bacterium]
MGEFELIRRYFAAAPVSRARLGIGDDCALLADCPPGECLAVSTDLLLAGRHFFEDVDPAALGWKSLAVNLSDLAAMGAQPVGFTLALALPVVDESWLSGFSAGLLDLAARHGCELLGGDTTRGPLAIGITIFGHVPPGQALRRDCGRADDDLWVSGELGAAAFAVRERLAGRPLVRGHPARERLERPLPRVALGRALLGTAHAAIDLSDGLRGDLGHLCERSRLGARIDWPHVPVSGSLADLPQADRVALALAGGDDYELLFSAPQAARETIAGLACEGAGGPVRIGSLTAEPGIRILNADATPISTDELSAFDHFR